VQGILALDFFTADPAAPRPGPGRATAAAARWHHRLGLFPGPTAWPRGRRHPRISPGGI